MTNQTTNEQLKEFSSYYNTSVFSKKGIFRNILYMLNLRCSNKIKLDEQISDIDDRAIKFDCDNLRTLISIKNDRFLTQNSNESEKDESNTRI